MYGDSSSNVLTELFVQYLSKVSEIQKSDFSKISELYIPIRPHPKNWIHITQFGLFPDIYGFFNANIYWDGRL